MHDHVSCPKCGNDFAIGAALRDQLEAEMRAQMKGELQRAVDDIKARSAQDLTSQLKEEADRAARSQAQMQKELTAARKLADAAAANEAELLRRQRQLDDRERAAALEFEQRLLAEKAKLVKQAEKDARARFEAESAKATAEAERLRLQAEQERARIEAELTEARKGAAKAAAREADLLRKQRELEERESASALTIARTLAAERAKVKDEAERVVAERMQLQTQQRIEDVRRENAAAVARMETDLVAARKRVDDAAAKELEVVAKQQELEDARRALNLETQKRLLEERRKMQEQIDAQTTERMAMMQEQSRLREKEQEEKNAQLQRTVDVLQQRLAQGAQQAQGEAQELVLKDILVETFDEDAIDDVAKGARGADLVQTVRTANRDDAGTILWESKRTQSWSLGWLEKLREDQREIGAVCAVVVTQALPPGIKTFGVIDGVWVCGWSYASALGAALRVGIQQVHQARLSADGRDTKMHRLYEYLVGHEFSNRIQGVIESIVSLEEELANEQRAYRRIWKKREATIRRALGQMSSVYGSLQGIVRGELADIRSLALPEAANLMDSGGVRKGKGRGGSVSRVATDQVAVVRTPARAAG